MLAVAVPLALAVLLAAEAGAASASPAVTVGVVETTSNLALHLTPLDDLHFGSVRALHLPVIHINDSVRYQRFGGIGAAMTDSSAWLINEELRPSARERLMEALFGGHGIRLGFMRVPMGASDFAVGGWPYSYDDLPQGQSDQTLAHFSITHDRRYIIPVVLMAKRINPGLEILANPWSPPGWMKANGSMDDAGGSGSLLPNAYKPFADYFVKFIKAYARAGVGIDAITPENEPNTGTFGTLYPGLTLPADDEAKFIADDLAPALSAAGLTTKIYGNDLSWVSSAYATALASGPDSAVLDGISWHCYFGASTAMSQFHQAHPGLDQIVDECSPEIRSFGTPEYLISSLRNWASVVALWNIALDPRGGPKLAANGCPGCEGLVTVNERTHRTSYTDRYFELGQVSKFVQPGATRIGSRNFVNYGVDASNIETITPGLDDVAFLNPDGSRVLVTYDNSSAPIRFAVSWRGRRFRYRIAARAMATFIWNPS